MHLGLIVSITPRTKLWVFLCFLSLLVMIVSEYEPDIRNNSWEKQLLSSHLRNKDDEVLHRILAV